VKISNENKSFVLNLGIIFFIILQLNSMGLALPYFGEERPLYLSLPILNHLTNMSLDISNAYSGSGFSLFLAPILLIIGKSSFSIHLLITFFSSFFILLTTRMISLPDKDTQYKDLFLFLIILSTSSHLLISFSLFNFQVISLFFISMLFYSRAKNLLTIEVIFVILCACSFHFSILGIITLLLIEIDQLLSLKSSKQYTRLFLYFGGIFIWIFYYNNTWIKLDSFTLPPSPYESMTSSYISSFLKTLTYIFISEGRFLFTLFLFYRIKVHSFLFNKNYIIFLILFMLFCPVINFSEKNFIIPIFFFYAIVFQNILSIKYYSNKVLLSLAAFSAVVNIMNYNSNGIFEQKDHSYYKTIQEISKIAKDFDNNPKKAIVTNFPLTLYLSQPEYGYTKSKHNITPLTSLPENCRLLIDKRLFLNSFFNDKINSFLKECQNIKSTSLTKKHKLFFNY